jgi:hypothetical protein
LWGREEKGRGKEEGLCFTGSGRRFLSALGPEAILGARRDLSVSSSFPEHGECKRQRGKYSFSRFVFCLWVCCLSLLSTFGPSFGRKKKCGIEFLLLFKKTKRSGVVAQW